MFDISNFRPISLADRTFFLECMASQDSLSCEMAFANIFLYQRAYSEKFLEYKGRILVWEEESNTLHFPIGEFFSSMELAEISRTLNDATIYDVPENYVVDETIFEVEDSEGDYDYIYEVDHLVAMSGALLRKKRNLIAQFERNNSYWHVEMITEESVATALDLAMALNRKLSFAEFLAKEEEAMELVRENFAPLEMGGILLYAEDEVVGFSLFSRINSNCADIHFEKADHGSKGAAQKLTLEVAKVLQSLGYIYMNREQDMDEDGLRRAKRSLDPCFMFKRRKLTLKR